MRDFECARCHTSRPFALRGSRLCSSGEGVWYYEVALLTDGLKCKWVVRSLLSMRPRARCVVLRGENPGLLVFVTLAFYSATGQGVGDHAALPLSADFPTEEVVPSRPRHTASVGAWADVPGVLLDLDLLEMRFFLNGRDLMPYLRVSRQKGFFPGASLNVGQAARFNFGHAPFLHPPSTTDGLPFHAVAEASGARGLSSSRILRSVGRADMAHHTFGRACGSRHGSRGVADGGDEEMTAELEIRRQTLIETLIGMGLSRSSGPSVRLSTAT